MQAAKYGIREFSQMKVLVINAGSSSLKYQLLDTESGEVMAKGLCERIGIDGVLTHTGNKSDEKFKVRHRKCPPTRKRSSLLSTFCSIRKKGVISSMSEIDAVGHRVVTWRRVLLGQRYHHREGPQGYRGLRTAGTASQSA